MLASRETVPKENVKTISDGDRTSNSLLNNAYTESWVEFGKKNFNFGKILKPKYLTLLILAGKALFIEPYCKPTQVGG